MSDLSVVPFEARHAAGLRRRYVQLGVPRRELGLRRLRRLAGPMAFTIAVGGRTVACIGLAPLNGGQAVGWALIAGDLPRCQVVALHRIALAGLNAARRNGFREIAALIDPDLAGGRRWAELLGFRVTGRVCPLPPDRRAYLWVMTRES